MCRIRVEHKYHDIFSCESVCIPPTNKSLQFEFPIDLGEYVSDGIHIE